MWLKQKKSIQIVAVRSSAIAKEVTFMPMRMLLTVSVHFTAGQA